MFADRPVVTNAPADVDPSDAKSYFKDSATLTNWLDARQPVAGEDRHGIPDGTTFACLADIKLDSYGDPYLVVADASCAADLFAPSYTGDSDKQTLKEHAGMMVAIGATIVKRLGNHSCHGSRYLIGPDLMLAALPYNPSKRELRRMEPGAQFVLQGTFQRYYEVTPGQTTVDPESIDTHGYLVIKTAEGETTTIHCWRSNRQQPAYDGGVLENLAGKPPVAGETIRIIGFTARRAALSNDLAMGTPSVGYNRPFLLAPDPERQAEYDQLRLLVSDYLHYLLEMIEETDWHNAREMFVILRRLELTDDESRRLLSIAESMPETERPVYLQDRYRADSVRGFLGTDPESLNREAFLVFAMDAIVGHYDKPDDESDGTAQSYLLDFWSQDGTVLKMDDLHALLAEGFTARFIRLHNASEDQSSYRSHRLMMNHMTNWLMYMEELPSHLLIHTVIGIVRQCIARNYFGRTVKTDGQGCPIRMRSILRDCIEALIAVYVKHARNMSQEMFVWLQDSLNQLEDQLTSFGADRRTLAAFQVKR